MCRTPCYALSFDRNDVLVMGTYYKQEGGTSCLFMSGTHVYMKWILQSVGAVIQ